MTGGYFAASGFLCFLVIFFGGLFLAERFVKEFRYALQMREPWVPGCFIIIGLMLGAPVVCGLVFTWLH
jgi:hypothetical protein